MGPRFRGDDLKRLRSKPVVPTVWPCYSALLTSLIRGSAASIRLR